MSGLGLHMPGPWLLAPLQGVWLCSDPFPRLPPLCLDTRSCATVPTRTQQPLPAPKALGGTALGLVSQLERASLPTSPGSTTDVRLARCHRHPALHACSMLRLGKHLLDDGIDACTSHCVSMDVTAEEPLWPPPASGQSAMRCR